jgi:hypothetical protein
MLCKNRNKKVGFCVMVVMASLVLVAVWAALATPETALAKKPGGGGSEEVLRGTATLESRIGDRVLSDGLGPEGEENSYPDGDTGKNDAVVLDLGGFFRFVVKEDRKGVGRRFVMDFSDDNGGLIVDPAFLPQNEYTWGLHVEGTLDEWRLQPEGVGVPREARIRFGTKGVDAANVNYGAGSSPDDGDPVTVTKIDTDVWTIESKSESGEEAQLFRDNGEHFGFASVPFLITYDGTP